VDGAKISEGPVRIGTVFRLVGKMPFRRFDVDYETTEYDEDRVVAWKAISGPLPLSFRREFEAVDEGCRVTIVYDLELHGVFKLFTRLLGRMGRRALEGDLPALQARLARNASET
jgi:hypothetical protein